MKVRFYVSSESYPEIREIRSRWVRQVTWLRAFRSAWGDRRFRLFLAVQAVILLAWMVLAEFGPRWLGLGFEDRWYVRGVVAVVAIGMWGLLALTWGGDLVRPHLRRVSEIARHACPQCGHQLTGHLAGDAAIVQCPECGAQVPRGVFEPPYEIPREFRAVRRDRRA